jgi:DNA adenine methylase
VGARRLPHPIPYQGSKRLLAPRILRAAGPGPYRALIEPFAGSAAVTLAAAAAGTAQRFVLGDVLAPLATLWGQVLDDPGALAAAYERVWTAQEPDPAAHYLRTRAAFNTSGGAPELLYLLARCVKNSPRFNAAGAFNQSADHRRRGMRPDRMRRELTGAAALLAGRTDVRCQDFEAALAGATPDDLVYLDPPWEGTSAGRDRRYRAGLDRARLVAALEDLDARGVPYLLSYDGRHGAKAYGAWLPGSIGATRLELPAGRSSQATLHGRVVTTVESLYVSRHVGAPVALSA